MECNTVCRPSFCTVAVFAAFALSVLVGILFGFGLLPLFEPVVYLLVGISVVFAGLFVAAGSRAVSRHSVYGCCFGRAARTWTVGFIGTIASALAVLAFVGIAPAWLSGVLIGLLTLFTALVLIGVACYAFCIGEALECPDMDE